ncbi:hypothetical protein BN844_5134 [Pseudomonas sp. SHC52]|nr:hypothetical protein BN844_5134 [Pseudomonas sp. SHC52]
MIGISSIDVGASGRQQCGAMVLSGRKVVNSPQGILFDNRPKN